MGDRPQQIEDFGSRPSEAELKVQQEQFMKEILDPSGSALLVVDMQRDYFAPDGKAATLWHQNVGPMQDIVPRIEELAVMFREQGRPVIFTQNYEDPELRSPAGKGRFLLFEEGDREGGVACLKGTPGAELVIKPEEGDIIIEKTSGSALIGTNLGEELERNGITKVFVTGVKTQRCVGTTTRDLYEHSNAYAIVMPDCVASDNVEQHNATLKELGQFFPPLVTSQQLKEAWTKAPLATPPKPATNS